MFRAKRPLRSSILVFMSSCLGCTLVLVGTSEARAEVHPLVGTYSKLKVKRGDTLKSIARRTDVNRELLASVNHIRNGRVRPGQTLTLPTLHILPRKPAEGIVLNIPERQVYLFRRGQTKAVFPVALGAKDWQTVTGVYKLASKEINPKWKPTKEMVEREDIKDDPVPPGKDNPVGDRWMGWSKKGYGFHSTIAPDSIGGAVSHGCVRLYPEAAHKMFDYVRVGETIYSIYEPMLVGRRENNYYFSVFPDIYHKNLVSAARAKAILQKEGLLSRVNMNEVARIVKRQEGYPVRLHLRPAPRKQAQAANHNPAKIGAKSANGSPKKVASPTAKPGHAAAKPKSAKAAPSPKLVSPPMPPDEIAAARAQGALLLARYAAKQVRLVNPDRDLPQLTQLAKLGYIEGADHRRIALAPGLRQALARLANRTSVSRPLVIMSMVRPYSRARPLEPHSSGLAADIAGFGGHTIDNRRPAEAVAAVTAILRALPAGKYRLGLPKAPGADPEAFRPPPPRVRNWPFFGPPVPQVAQLGAVTLVSPRMDGPKPVLDSHGRFTPEIVSNANERAIPLSELGDQGLRRTVAACAKSGVNILLAFPDAADHLHLDVPST